MNKINFVIIGEKIESFTHTTKMSDVEVENLLKTEIDLGHIITEVSTKGTVTVGETENHFDYTLEEIDGNEQPYEFDESNVYETSEVVKSAERTGLFNISQA